MNEPECSIWLTVDNKNPTLEDIAKLQCKMEEMGLDYKGKIGVCFTPQQWCHFLCDLSKFESRFATMVPRSVMGFPVRLIHFHEE